MYFYILMYENYLRFLQAAVDISLSMLEGIPKTYKV